MKKKYSVCFLSLWGKGVPKNAREEMLRTLASHFHNDLFSNAKDYLKKRLCNLE